MKSKIFTAIGLGLGLAFAEGHTTTILASEKPTIACTQVGRILKIQGTLQLKRQGWSGYRQVSNGTVLCLGDLLRSAKGTTAIVQCVDPRQNLWNVPGGVTSGAANGCRPPSKPMPTITGPITPTRDPLARQIPHIIMPDRTWLLNDKPTLRWQAVPGASSYIVRLTGSGVTWETEVNTTSITYPGNPPLQPNEAGYLLTVEADNGELPAKATFGLLNQQQAQLVKESVDRLNQQNLSESTKTLALVDLYLGQELIAEALEQLEVAATKGSKTAAIYQALGDLYSYVGLMAEAEKHYLQTVQLATAAEDIETATIAATRLGEIYPVLGNVEKALLWLKTAQQGYESLGNLQLVQEMENRQHKLENL
jgi:hypothetical protein